MATKKTIRNTRKNLDKKAMKAKASIKGASTADNKDTAPVEASVPNDAAESTKEEDPTLVDKTANNTGDSGSAATSKEVQTISSKASARSTTRKRTNKPKQNAVVEENYFEIGGDQVRVEDVRSRIEQAYKDAGHRIGNIKKLQVYYNFEERRAYYVVNDKAEGLYVEF